MKTAILSGAVMLALASGGVVASGQPCGHGGMQEYCGPSTVGPQVKGIGPQPGWTTIYTGPGRIVSTGGIPGYYHVTDAYPSNMLLEKAKQ